MVMFSNPDPPGNHYNYYVTRRTPFVALHNSEVARYNSEVVPEYTEHDARIRGVPYETPMSSEQYRLQSSTDTALVQRSSSSRREVQSSSDKALIQRPSSCSREVQTSGYRGADVTEYIKHGAHAKEYVVEEQIPPQYNYHLPSKKTQMELMTLGDTATRAHSVPPRPESQPQWIKIPSEPGLLYFVPLSESEHKSWPGPREPMYFDHRRAVFTKPQGTYDAKQQECSSCLDRRSRSHSREHTQKQQVIYENASSKAMHNMANSRNENFEKALVPFDRSQSVPPAQNEYTSQWIKIPAGPSTTTVYPAITSSDPRTWTQEKPLQITNSDTHKAVDSSYSHDDAVVKRASSQMQEKSVLESVTYEHIPKQDMSLEKKEINIDQRFDRSHRDNRGPEYRSKWVTIPRGPSAMIYSSIHARDKDACMDPTLTGYVGNGSYLESSEKSVNKKESDYTQTSLSTVNKKDTVDKSSFRVNKILNTKEDLEKKDFVDMLFNIQHILKEREALGAYEISSRMKNKMNFLTKAINEVSIKNKNRNDIGSHPTESVKSILSYSNLLAPTRPDHGRTNATTRFNYMLHEPRVL